MKVVLISLDALFDQDLPLMRQQPFFGEFLAHASGCTHVRTVYPALTYPAHHPGHRTPTAWHWPQPAPPPGAGGLHVPLVLGQGPGEGAQPL